jgi:hypothetical protein
MRLQGELGAVRALTSWRSNAVRRHPRSWPRSSTTSIGTTGSRIVWPATRQPGPSSRKCHAVSDAHGNSSRVMGRRVVQTIGLSKRIHTNTSLLNRGATFNHREKVTSPANTSSSSAGLRATACFAPRSLGPRRQLLVCPHGPSSSSLITGSAARYSTPHKSRPKSWRLWQRPNSALHRTWSRALLRSECATISCAAPSR